MKKTIILTLLLLISITGCKKEKVNIMKVPIVAEDFYTLQNNITLVCTQINSTICSYIKGPITLYLKDSFTPGYILSGDETIVAEKLYKRLNGKTPEQIIEEYKKMLKQNLDNDIKRDINVTKTLDNIEKTYKKTRHFAKDIVIKDVHTNIGSDNIIQIGFTIENNTPFNVWQFSGEV